MIPWKTSGAKKKNKFAPKLFISSPGDVREERDICQRVAERLNDKPELKEKGFQIEVLRWDKGNTPPQVGEDPQEVVDYYIGKSEETDIVVCLFWSRMGSPVSVGDWNYDSGTYYEFQHAYYSYLLRDKPRVFLYRKKSPPPKDAAPGQLKAVDNFFKNIGPESSRHTGLYREFETASDFEEELENDLLTVCRKLTSEEGKEKGVRKDLIENVRLYLNSFYEAGDNVDRITASLPFFSRLQAREQGNNEPITDMLKSFEDNSGKLLILGEAGLGKTYHAVNLMTHLLEKARRSPDKSIPVLLNLSSYNERAEGYRGSIWSKSKVKYFFDEWAIDELTVKYSIPRQHAKRFVENRQLIYFLDGLDEILLRTPNDELDHEKSQKLRLKCMKALSDVLKDNPELQVVLCSRTKTFEEIKFEFSELKRIEILPLSKDDVITLLNRMKGCEGLREAAQLDENFLKKLQIPLFLRFMTIGLRGKTAPHILDICSKSDWQRDVYGRYIRACTERLHDEGTYRHTKEEITYYLRFLAKWPESVFLLENLQPFVLTHEDWRWYDKRANLCIGIILTCLVTLSSMLGIVVEWLMHDHSVAEIIEVGGKIIAAGSFLIFPLMFYSFYSRKWYLFGLVLGFAFGLLRSFVVGLSSPATDEGRAAAILAFIVTTPAAIAVFCLLGIYLFPKRGQLAREKDIFPLETWNWKFWDQDSPLRGGWIGCIVGPGIGYIFYLSFGPVRGLTFGTITTALVVFFAGLAVSGIPTKVQPNQGIVRSLWNAIIFSGAFSLFGMTSCFIYYGLWYGLTSAVVNLMLASVLLFTFFTFGGIPVIKQFVLGKRLAYRGYTPEWKGFAPWANYVNFLDDMVRIRLLRRQGGGYSFRHITLKKHFQELTNRSLWH